MGSWGSGTLDNDDSWDWLNDWHEEVHRYNLTDTLEAVTGFPQEEYLELPDELRTWAASQPDPVPASLLDLTLRAVRRIRTNSEMQEVWAESEEGAAWEAAMGDLQARLIQQPL